MEPRPGLFDGCTHALRLGLSLPPAPCPCHPVHFSFRPNPTSTPAQMGCFVNTKLCWECKPYFCFFPGPVSGRKDGTKRRQPGWCIREIGRRRWVTERIASAQAMARRKASGINRRNDTGSALQNELLAAVSQPRLKERIGNENFFIC